MNEQLIESPSLRRQVRDHLRAAILTGEIAPGERISPSEVAARFGVSTMPVRDALQLLEQDGLVETSARRSTRVVELDPGLVAEVLPIVSLLEQHAILTAPQPTEEELARLRDVNRRFAEAIEAGDLPGVIAADTEFHRGVVAVARNGSLEQALRVVTTRLQLLRPRVVHPAIGSASVDDHRTVVDCLESGDREGAARAIAANWGRGLERFLVVTESVEP